MISSTKIRGTCKRLLDTVDIQTLGKKYQGKVRDFYIAKGQRILITTDRISAFDRVLGLIPFKGQVLNQLSAFWFDQTKDIVQNHLIEVIHPNISIVKEAKPYPVEMVVRGYISGVTKTSLWKSYEEGERIIYGLKFPDGLRKNQKLKNPVLTPTTKAEHGAHDEKLTHDEILKRKLLDKKTLEQMEKVAIELFVRGNKVCNKRGLILVDTKYEFGEYKGKLMLIDEIHTPDSSRFWKAKNYQERFQKGMEPENFDKEFFRIWYAKKGYRGDGEPPEMPLELKIKTAQRYIKIYEMITGKKFKSLDYPLEKDINESIKNYNNI
jgi:phosphoribosylaminoimidazole-succinocarboxamide synthase